MQRVKIDKTTLLLVLFIILLSSLFYYLYLTQKNIGNYTRNHDRIGSLIVLDQQLDNFTLSVDHYSNYDRVNKRVEEFKKIFAKLQENLLKTNPQNALIKKELTAVGEEFRKKADDVEYFKSLNASLINSTHFIFDLQRTIASDKHLSKSAKITVNEILFYLMRFTTNEAIPKEYLVEKLQILQKMQPKQHSFYLHNFYKQALVMLDTMASLKNLSKEMNSGVLYNHLKELHATLDNLYKKNISIGTLITVLFFLSSIIILIILIVMHRRSLNREKELFAFKYAMQHSDNTIVITDADKKIIFVNEAFEKSSGYTEQEALGKNPNILKSGRQNEAFYKELNTKLSHGEKWEGQFINKRKDGSLFYEKASIVPVFSHNKLINYLAIKLDVSEYIEQNRKLSLAASVFENTEEAIIIANEKGLVISVNKAFVDIYGYTLDEIEGKNLSLLHSHKQNRQFYTEMWNELVHKGLWRGKIVNRSKAGDEISVWTTIKKVRNEADEMFNYIALQTDLREIEASQAKADYLAYHDVLTGLYNRVNFEEYLTHALSLAKRTQTELAVLFIDLDRFKIINDTLGHDIGDEVLKVVALRLRKTFRESDFISRWGGDEFVAIVENVSRIEDIVTVATKVIETLQKPMEIKEHTLVVTASVGIARFPEAGEDANSLIKHADSAMYQAKDMGKNRFSCYTKELSQDIQSKLVLDIALRNALQKNEIFMVFQPQYNLQTKAICAVEALVRWQSDELGFVPPDKFIPIAEENGLIVSLGYFIFEASCQGYKAMKEAGVPLKRIAINVSSVQFQEKNLLEKFLAIATKEGVSPSEIEIEITERFLMQDTHTNMLMLDEFRKEGFEISIDDFGTGYSSMSYLKRLPIDTIKIDKSFVDDIGVSKEDNAIVEAIVALSKTLGYKIVAEGIEEQPQEEFLASTGCDVGQGYIFSKPAAMEEIIERFALLRNAAK